MDRYLEKFKNMEENKNNIIKDNNFMKWIASVIDSRGILFSDDDSDKIEYLYRAVDYYVNNNYIYFDDGELDNCYYIKYNNRFYEIGIFAGQGIYFYVKLVNKEVNNYIDFIDIVNNKRKDKANDIDNKMAKIKYLIDTLNGIGVPVPVIKSKIEDYLSQIDNRVDTKVKILKK